MLKTPKDPAGAQRPDYLGDLTRLLLQVCGGRRRGLTRSLPPCGNSGMLGWDAVWRETPTTRRSSKPSLNRYLPLCCPSSGDHDLALKGI